MQNQALRDKLAEEIVTEQRLRLIERDHRSIGSILDNRYSLSAALVTVTCLSSVLARTHSIVFTHCLTNFLV